VIAMSKRLPSLELLAAEIAHERQEQSQHANALDSKAGITLGFAGALVALASDRSIAAIVGRGFAVIAALMALLAFAPRPFPVLELRRLRDTYLTSEPDFTRLHMLDTHVRMAEESAALIKTGGGPTCVTNTNRMCPFHHLLKTKGWRLAGGPGCYRLVPPARE
jgi:hypothetical protein